METVLRIITASVLLAGTAGIGTPTEARAEGDFCGLYCDSIYLGCKATIGRLDEEACEEFHEGCLEGCAVEHD